MLSWETQAVERRSEGDTHFHPLYGSVPPPSIPPAAQTGGSARETVPGQPEMLLRLKRWCRFQISPPHALPTKPELDDKNELSEINSFEEGESILRKTTLLSLWDCYRIQIDG